MTSLTLLMQEGELVFDRVEDIAFEGEWLIFKQDGVGWAYPAHRIRHIEIVESATDEL